MSNKSEGNKFETEFCQILSDNGYWVHNMAQNQAGQPADVIACKNGRVFLIDCKVCENDRFPVSRVEPNQASAMKLFEHCGNAQGLFALKMCKQNQIYILALDDITNFIPRRTKSTMDSADVRFYGSTIGDWLKQVDISV